MHIEHSIGSIWVVNECFVYYVHYVVILESYKTRIIIRYIYNARKTKDSMLEI